MSDAFHVGPLSPEARDQTLVAMRWLAVEAHRALEALTGWRWPVELAITQKDGRGFASCLAAQKPSPQRGWEPLVVLIARPQYRNWKDLQPLQIAEEVAAATREAFAAQALPPWPRWPVMEG